MFAVGVALYVQLASGSADAFVIVAHRDVPVSSLSAEQASKIFLRRQSAWPDKTAVVAVDQPAASSARQAFSQQVHGRSAQAIDAYWQQQVFGARGVPPVVVASDAAVLSEVRQTKGAIGYVSAAAAQGALGVKIIHLDSVVATSPSLVAFNEATYKEAALAAMAKNKVYPRKAAVIGAAGKCLVVVSVKETGALAAKPRLFGKGTGHGVLDEECVALAERTPFPPLPAGVAGPVVVRLPVEFSP